MAHDPRAICNLILDEARSTPVGNLALQKLLYFAHGLFLNETGRPLVSGYFEAWKYGPVHPGAYRAFKSAGDAPIQFRAKGRDPMSGQERDLNHEFEDEVHRCIQRIMASYGSMTAGRLVDLSHARGAPWDVVVEQGRSGVAFGLRISNSLIETHFKHHKVSVGEVPNVGEPHDDSPFNS